MELTGERRAALLAYCKLTELADDPEVELLLPALYEAAVGYMEGAGIAPPEPHTPRAAQYDLCVNYLALWTYEQRDACGEGSAAPDNPVFRRMLTQLKLTQGGAAL